MPNAIPHHPNAISHHHAYNCAQVYRSYNCWKYPVSESIPDNEIMCTHDECIISLFPQL